jgi:ribosome production factor 2
MQRDAVRLSRKNEDMRPFEAGGEVQLERLARKADAGLFALDSHNKKRPHNLVLGRLFDHRLYDLVRRFFCLLHARLFPLCMHA